MHDPILTAHLLGDDAHCWRLRLYAPGTGGGEEERGSDVSSCRSGDHRKSGSTVTFPLTPPDRCRIIRRSVEESGRNDFMDREVTR